MKAHHGKEERVNIAVFRLSLFPSLSLSLTHTPISTLTRNKVRVIFLWSNVMVIHSSCRYITYGKLNCFDVFNLWAKNDAYKQPFLSVYRDSRGDAKKKTNTTQALRTKESRPLRTQKVNTCKRPCYSGIWLNFADIFDQIPGRCLAFFCVIDCQRMFDCRFILFTFIKSSLYNKD